MLSLFFLAGWILSNGLASEIGRRSPDVDVGPITLGNFKPTCAKLTDSGFGGINTGLKLGDFKTFFTFGDSWTDLGDRVGGVALPPMKPKGNCPFYGGRPTNGKMWTEWLAEILGNGAVVRNYAISGATVDHELWHSASKKADMTGEIDVFLCQQNKIDPASTLVTLFFGNNDISASRIESNDMPSMQPAARNFLVQTERLVKAGLTNLLVLTPAFSSGRGKEFSTVIWNGLKDLRARYTDLEFITVDLAELYNAIKASPHSFGYHSTDSCLPKTFNMKDACTDPDYRLFWIFLHPQTLSHRLQAEFIKEVSETCTISDSNSTSTDFVSNPSFSPPSSQDGSPNTNLDFCKNLPPVRPPPNCN